MQVSSDPRSSDPYEPDPAAEPRRGYGAPPRPPGITLDRVIRFILGAGTVVALAWVLWYFAALVIYLIIGILLAYLMKPIVDRLQGLGVGRIAAIGVAFVVVFGGISILLTYLVPFATRQITDLSQQISFEKAAVVTAVEPGSPARLAGLQNGDFIVSIDGEAWQGYSQLQAVLRSKRPGEPLMLVYEDAAGARQAASLDVEALQEGAAAVQAPQAEAPAERRIEPLGLTVREVSRSDVATAIENRLRRILPALERGALIESITTGIEQLFQGQRITDTVGSVVDLFTNLFYAVVVIPFVSFFFLKDGTYLRHSMLRMVPNRYFEIALTTIEKVETNIGRYFRGLLIQCISIATVASILLSIAGLQYALAVGVFTGLANTIPYFGPLMGFIAGTLVGITQTGDFSLVPGVLVAMGLTQLADNIFFQPLIFSRAARTHPLAILFVVLIGAQLAGIIGMLIAIPVTTTIRVIVQQILWSLRNYRILKTA